MYRNPCFAKNILSIVVCTFEFCGVPFIPVIMALCTLIPNYEILQIPPPSIKKLSAKMWGSAHACRNNILLYKLSVISHSLKPYSLLTFVLSSLQGEVASKTSLRLTRKNNVFMAGFPVRALDEWQRTLVEAGFQLAICNQIKRM